MPIVALCVLFFAGVGCSATRPSFRPFWDKAPPARRSAKSVESSTSTAKKEPSNEPAVAANVALNANDDESNSARPPRHEDRSKSSTARTDARAGQSDPRKPGIAVDSDSSKSTETTSDAVAETERTDSPFDRFNAVLSDEIPFAESLPQESLTALAERLRIDSLIMQAKQLLDSGQLEQAVQKAQQAQDLSEKIQIDYTPDEDRPIDLVRRIQGQLEATRLKDESNSGSGVVEMPAPPAESNKSETLTKTSKPGEAPTKDSSSLARIRRDWSTLFRQKKKPVNPDPTTTAEMLETSLSAAPIEPTLPNPPLTRFAKSEGSDAIVMANRSVSLGTTESLTASSASYVPEKNEKREFVPDAHRSDLQSSQDPTIPSFQDARENPVVDFVETTRPIIDSADIGEPVTDFDVGELTVPSSKSKFSVKANANPEQIEPNETVHENDWTGLYLGLGLCGLLAIGCFRRETT